MTSELLCSVCLFAPPPPPLHDITKGSTAQMNSHSFPPPFLFSWREGGVPDLALYSSCSTRDNSLAYVLYTDENPPLNCNYALVGEVLKSIPTTLLGFKGETLISILVRDLNTYRA